MGSVPNEQKEILMHDPIRWFKCKLKPPKNTFDKKKLHKKTHMQKKATQKKTKVSLKTQSGSTETCPFLTSIKIRTIIS